MQQMQDANNDAPDAAECAAQLMEVAPAVMRTIRREMRRQRAADLSVPQFRSLGYLSRHPGAPLLELAEHLGLTAPATSRLVEGLVARGYAARQTNTSDRRSVALTATAKGAEMLAAAQQHVRGHLAEMLSALSTDERATVARAIELLRPLFANSGHSHSHLPATPPGDPDSHEIEDSA